MRWIWCDTLASKAAIGTAAEGKGAEGEETLLAWLVCKPAGMRNPLVDGAETLLMDCTAPNVLGPAPIEDAVCWPVDSALIL